MKTNNLNPVFALCLSMARQIVSSYRAMAPAGVDPKNQQAGPNPVLSCEMIDTLFVESEQAVTKGLIKKKIVQKNAYYGKIPDEGSFPLHSGTRIRGWRLGRIGVPDDRNGWRPVEDELCSTNACSFEPEVIGHGSSDYFFSLVQRDLRTDWLCIDSLALRAIPEEELMHLEDGLRNAARYVHEEFRRSRYLLFGANKLVAILPDSGDWGDNNEVVSCDGSEMLNAGYVFEYRANGEMDESHVRVCCAPADLGNIGTLTLDMLDYASERLEYEDDAYLDNTGLFDVLLPSRTLAVQLAQQEAQDMGTTDVSGGVNIMDLRREFGTDRVIRNYSLRSDIHAMRFYPDNAANTAMTEEQGYAFDASDPSTWARLVRVYPYKPKKAKIAGIEYVTNPAYLKAPFGITTIRHNRVMSVMSFPPLTGVGPAKKEQMGGLGYDGVAVWQNPDWECNVNRDKGFWKMRFRLAAKQNREEEGYSWLTRIGPKLILRGNLCELPSAPCEEDITPYCFEGMGGSTDSGLGVNAAVGN